jgi:sialate O-acetylesterase
MEHSAILRALCICFPTFETTFYHLKCNAMLKTTIKFIHFVLVATAVAWLPKTLFAQTKLAYLFSENMVLQQQTQANIWGWDKPGSTITIKPSWDNKKYSTKTDASGKWKTAIPTPAAGGPYEITINDGQPITLHNIMIGEVWLCTGQSNMEMPMKGFKNQPVLGSNEAIITSKNKNIRLFTVPRSSKTEKQDTIKQSKWLEANPESVSNFSATGYFFGKQLYDMLDIPVGLINISYGGSSVEAWMSATGLQPFTDIKVPAPTDSIKAVSRTPTTLYNAMLHPAIGYSIKGCIWYQGESNYDRPDQYEQLFPAMVKEWRGLWGIGEFPFYYTQIAPYDYAQLPPYNAGGKYNSAYLRDAQRKSLTKIPNSGMISLMDIGEQKSIHPMHKKEGGQRLALLALNNTYGIKGFGYASPIYDSMSVAGNVANISFRYIPNGLTSFGKDITNFEIAGADKFFYPAQVAITAKGVAVSAPQVKQPVAVRYAFKDFVMGELFSTEGLPVASFRTDDW